MRATNHWWLSLGVGVGFVVLSTSHALAADPPPVSPSAAPDDATMAEARKHFQAGVNLLDDPDGARYEEAFQAFQKAYALSKSPKVLGNIGFCSLKLERDGEAIDAYTTYLRESRDVDPQERAQIERDLSTLSSTTATFRVTVKAARPDAHASPASPGSDGGYVLVDTRTQTRGSPVVNSYPFSGAEMTLRLRPGRHAIKVKGREGESPLYEVAVEPASRGTHDFTIAPPVAVTAPREVMVSKPSYAGPILLGVVGLLGLGTGAVTGLMARSKADELATACPNDLCPNAFDLRSHRAEAKTWSTVADVSLVAGGVAVGGALLWGLLVPSGSRTPRSGAPGASPSGLRTEAGCTARGCGFAVGGAF